MQESFEKQGKGRKNNALVVLIELNKEPKQRILLPRFSPFLEDRIELILSPQMITKQTEWSSTLAI